MSTPPASCLSWAEPFSLCRLGFMSQLPSSTCRELGSQGFLMAQTAKSACNGFTSLSGEKTPGDGNGYPPSILAWQSKDRCYSPRASQESRHDCVTDTLHFPQQDALFSLVFLICIMETTGTALQDPCRLRLCDFSRCLTGRAQSCYTLYHHPDLEKTLVQPQEVISSHQQAKKLI